MSIRRVAEILWAIGWEPHFEARPIPAGQNLFYEPAVSQPAVSQPPPKSAVAVTEGTGKLELPLAA